MAISSVGSNARPGVCTSTTRPTTPFEGQLIYETDTNRVLVFDASAWVMIADTDAPPALQLVKTQTVGSAVPSVTVTNAFNADFDSYLIQYTNGTMSSSTDIGLRLEGLTSGYYGSAYYDSYLGTANGINRINNQAEWFYVGGGDSTGCMVNCTVYNPFAAVPTFMTYQSWSGGVFTIFGAGKQANYTSVTDFRLRPLAGTFTGGTIRVYGYRNS